jgi:hypothetical protein
MKVINAMENPGTKESLEVKQHVDPLHKEFDSLHAKAREQGVDIGYRENYITHFWDKAEDIVKQEYQAFKQREFIQNDRQIPTYAEGIKMGLKPKYTHPAPILADYAQRLEKLKANLEFINEAKKNGFVVDASVGMGQPGFVPIAAPGFPKSITKGPDGKMVVGPFYAPQQIAEQINRIFSPEATDNLSKGLRVSAKVSSTIQDVGLSGGIPGTPMNAFTAAQVQKEILSGRVVSPISSFVRAISSNATKKFFQKNAEQIKKMQVRNIPVRSSYSIEDVLGKEAPTGLGGKGKELWTKMMNEPTFKRFMPMLQINLFNDIEKQALKGGRSPEAAADIAASAVQKFYGITKSDTTAKRTEMSKNLMKTALFAPHYRESMINFWKENVKAMRHPLALENRTNVKFMAGSLMALGTMNFLNEQYMGNGLLENPPGKEDKLLIPVDDGQGTVIGIPFLSSIATIPRAMFRQGKMLAEGDIKGAVTDAGSSYLSMGIKPLFDVAKNSDYFGKEIVNEADMPGEKLKKQAGYLAAQYSGHPYLKEALSPSNQGDPLYQRASRATELPFRFYSQDSLNKGTFYDEYYKLKPLAEQHEQLAYQDPEKAQQFATQNADKLDRFEYMKQVQGAFYDQKDKGVTDTSILAGAKGQMPQGTSQVGNRIIYKDDEGKYKYIDPTEEPTAPKLTGNYELDKKLISKYKGEVTSKKNDIVKMYELGMLSADEAEKRLSALTASSGTGKKPKKVKARKAPAFKQPKFKRVKAKKIKLAKIKLSSPTSKKKKPLYKV